MNFWSTIFASSWLRWSRSSRLWRFGSFRPLRHCWYVDQVIDRLFTRGWTPTTDRTMARSSCPTESLRSPTRSSVRRCCFSSRRTGGPNRATAPVTAGVEFDRRFSITRGTSRVGQYKRYEAILKCELRGFRLLVLTEEPARFAALCRLVRAMSPTGFVWLADRDRLLSQGLWSLIWVRGGKVNEPLQSILGSKVPNPCPTPASVA